MGTKAAGVMPKASQAWGVVHVEEVDEISGIHASSALAKTLWPMSGKGAESVHTIHEPALVTPCQNLRHRPICSQLAALLHPSFY